MEPILLGDVLLTKSCKHPSKRLQHDKTNGFPGGCYGCEVEQHCGQHHGADRNGSGWFWRVASDWLRLAGGLKAELLYLSAPPQLFFNTCGAKRQVSDSGYFRILD
jgi:hypothetical protein